MVYRERYETDFSEERSNNIGLRRRSILGPWLVTGLGVVLILFLSYLVYSNLLIPPVAMPSPERSLRIMVEPTSSVTVRLPKRFGKYAQPQHWGTGVPAVPQSRAANALLGGEGPAALPGIVAATTLGPSAAHPSNPTMRR